METLLRVKTMKVSKDLIENEIKSIIKYEHETQKDKNGVYRDNFGSSILRSTTPEKVYKGKTNATIMKNFNDFYENALFEKHKIIYSIIGQHGYIAYAPKIEMYIDEIKGPFTTCGQTFSNITFLKQFAKSYDIRKRNISEFIYNKKGEIVGIIGVIQKVYNKQPKTIPTKYKWIDEYVEIAYGGYVSK